MMMNGDEKQFDGLPQDININDLLYYLITSVDVERSFSTYKNMLTDNHRQSNLRT